MSRYGTVLGGTANARAFVVQGADPDSLLAAMVAASAALAAVQPPMVDPVTTSLTLTGAGDGHTFVLEVENAASANVDGGADVIGTPVFLIAATAEELERQLAALQSTDAILDVQIAGAAKGQRVMAMVVYGTLRPSSGLSPRFASVSGAVFVVPGNNVPTDIGAPGVAFTSATGKARLMVTVVGIEENGVDPVAGITAVSASVTQDGVALGNAYGELSFVPAAGSPPNIPAFTLTFLSVEALDLLAHTYSIICQCAAPTGVSADGVQVLRSTLTIEDVAP